MNEALRGFPATGWFTACGLPLEPSDLADARAYLDALGVHASVRVEPVASWTHAERLIRNPAWDVYWWEREEVQRRSLMEACVRRLGEAKAMETLSLGVGVEHDIIHAAATNAAARHGVTDQALVRAAAGAAAMVAHARALARLAQAPEDHLFMRKYALFEGGRWPLGIVSGAFHLF